MREKSGGRTRRKRARVAEHDRERQVWMGRREELKKTGSTETNKEKKIVKCFLKKGRGRMHGKRSRTVLCECCVNKWDFMAAVLVGIQSVVHFNDNDSISLLLYRKYYYHTHIRSQTPSHMNSPRLTPYGRS